MTAHLGDVLSALLDGELDPATAAAAQAHLDDCHTCAAELAAVAGTRSVVRGLPTVDPPFGFYERLLRRRSNWRRGVAALVGTAAAAVTRVTYAAPGAAPVQPRVADAVATHAATASVTGDPLSQLAPAGVPVSFKP